MQEIIEPAICGCPWLNFSQRSDNHLQTVVQGSVMGIIYPLASFPHASRVNTAALVAAVFEH